MIFNATKTRVLNRGVPPDDFLETTIGVVNSLPDDVFTPNNNKDIYGLIKPALGPWDGTVIQRKAAMLEAMRVHAGLESSWNWNEGVDTTNAISMAVPPAEETGVFQVSQDSLGFDKPPYPLHDCIGQYGDGLCGPEQFIPIMKSNHPLAVEYYARLVRISIAWAGPLISVHGKPPAILSWLSRAAMAEFQSMLS